MQGYTVRSMRSAVLALVVFAVMAIAPTAASACSVASFVWDGSAGAGDTKWTTASNWVTNAVPTAGQTVCIPTGFDVTYDAAAAAPGLVAVSNGSQLTIAAGMTFTSSNLTLDAGGSVYSYGTLSPANIAIGTGAGVNIIDGGVLQPTAGSSITGTGTLVFEDPSAPSAAEIGGSGALTIDGPEVTVMVDSFDINNRAVTLASNTMSFPGATAVTKSASGSLTIASGATLERTGLPGTMTLPSLINNGTVHVEYYELEVTGSNSGTTLSGGDWIVDAGAELTVSGQLYTGTGASFTGPGTITVTNDMLIDDPLTINANTTLTIQDRSFMGYSGMETVQASSTSCTTCVVEITSPSFSPQLSGLTIAQGITVAQEGDVTIGGVVEAVDLDGRWVIDDPARHMYDAVSVFNIGSTGELEADCSGGSKCALDFNALDNQGTIELTGGTAEITIVGTLDNIASGTLTGGTWIVRSGAKLDLPATGRITTNAATVTLDGSGSQIREVGVTGSIFDTISANSGTLTLSGGAQLGTSATPFASSGTLAVGSGSTLTGATNITGGTLSLGGTMAGSLTVTGGTMAIASAPSTATVSGAFTLASGGTFATRVAGSASSSHDLLTVTGAASFAGALTVNAASYAPAASDSIRVVSAASTSGSPASSTVSSLASPWSLSTTVDSTGLVLAPTESEAPGAPGTPTTTSGHSSSAVTFDTTVDIAWTAASDGSGSGIAGYSVEFSQSATTDPDTTADVTALAATSSDLAEGWWYAHVRAIDADGNVSATAHSTMFYVGVHATGCTMSGATRLSSTGTSGADRLIGTSGRDTLRGNGGADQLVAGSGIDRVYGGTGADLMCLGASADIAYGQGGADRILGEGGADVINPGAGADTVLAGAGADRISAADGTRDVVNCGSGLDRVVADVRDRVIGCEVVTRR